MEPWVVITLFFLGQGKRLARRDFVLKRLDPKTGIFSASFCRGRPFGELTFVLAKAKCHSFSDQRAYSAIPTPSVGRAKVGLTCLPRVLFNKIPPCSPDKNG